MWPKLVERYGERLEHLYAEISAHETQELLDLRRTAGDQPMPATVQRAARALLVGSMTEVSPAAHFRDLGGDSLSAVSLSNLLHDTFGVRVPVDVIISPAHDLRQLAAYVESKRTATATRPTFASVHGEDATEAHAKDLVLGRFIDAATLDGARRLPRPAGEPRRVLLTGASGYLGRFLTLEWLHRLAPADGKLIVVVRGKDPDAARQRLADAFGSEDSELTCTFEELAAEHLEVLAGDIAEPRLGLDEATWERLTGEVDLIVHAGALVNHVLPYRHLFDANVLGTAELIRLSLTERLKPVTYISSVAVSRSRRGQPLDEDTDLRAALPVQPLDDGYAGGYTTSKWAGEVLLREAHDLCDLPEAQRQYSVLPLLQAFQAPGEAVPGRMSRRPASGRRSSRQGAGPAPCGRPVEVAGRRTDRRHGVAGHSVRRGRVSVAKRAAKLSRVSTAASLSRCESRGRPRRPGSGSAADRRGPGRASRPGRGW
ncbi:SDR family oxidoreductase [Streptomyces sp. NPDC096310]|uniref:SDR family oxidoreductase n=1 Tax=Streptomyces sp. NPDC096310 TaxID=3366082 RepID=UPI0038258CAE